MKKLLKRLLRFSILLVVAICLVEFGPALMVRFFGSGNTQWISERFSESLKEKNELVVYEVETTGQETVSQDAWLIGTVQRVEIPYTFEMCFTVDLSSATVTANENVIEVRVPTPVGGYQKLTVNEQEIKKSDWLYPLTPERYEEMKQDIESRLFEEYASNDEYRQNAWGVTVRNLETLFSSIAEQSAMGQTCDIKIVADETLAMNEQAY